MEYLHGKSVYRADPRASGNNGGLAGSVYANHEVIISGGAFNTPQLLKLSGIGPADELRAYSIPVIQDMPGKLIHYFFSNIKDISFLL